MTACVIVLLICSSGWNSSKTQSRNFITSNCDNRNSDHCLLSAWNRPEYVVSVSSVVMTSFWQTDRPANNLTAGLLPTQVDLNTNILKARYSPRGVPAGVLKQIRHECVWVWCVCVWWVCYPLHCRNSRWLLPLLNVLRSLLFSRFWRERGIIILRIKHRDWTRVYKV